MNDYCNDPDYAEMVMELLEELCLHSYLMPPDDWLFTFDRMLVAHFRGPAALSEDDLESIFSLVGTYIAVP